MTTISVTTFPQGESVRPNKFASFNNAEFFPMSKPFFQIKNTISPERQTTKKPTPAYP
jgi:hypothetical protein